MSAFESLMMPASAIHQKEEQEEHLRKCAEQVHKSLMFVWPKSKDEPSFHSDVHAHILAKEYYLCSMLTTHFDGHDFNANILVFMAESNTFTPLPAL